MAMESLALVGNPRPGSRTAGLARYVLDTVSSHVAAAGDRTVLDLADLSAELGPPLGADAAQRYAEPLRRLTSARLLIVATPTYKGSYTGLLKSFLDHVPAGALRHAVAVPLITVGSPKHALAADVHLRPLLVELGAVTPTPALVVGEDSLPEPAGTVATWLGDAGPALRNALPADCRRGQLAVVAGEVT